MEWVRAHSFAKGSPNLTAARFRIWVNDVLLPLVAQHHPQIKQAISVWTAAHWLHALGFHPSQSHKGMYFDGHEQENIVDYRKIYLWKLEILESTHAPPSHCSDDPIRDQQEDESKKEVVLIYHDESTFHSNDGQGWLWAEAGKQPIRPRGQGRGIMVSDYIDELFGTYQSGI